jgi:hypothetical protein
MFHVREHEAALGLPHWAQPKPEIGSYWEASIKHEAEKKASLAKDE